jgi:hypothetical protein
MSDYQCCERCKEYTWGACKCARFRCGVPWKDKLDPDDMDDAVWAMDAESAAEKCAELRDSDGDYTIIKHGEGEIWVLDEDDVLTKWVIEAESVPTYHAHEKRVTSNPNCDGGK